jgi:hypothetical protein
MPDAPVQVGAAGIFSPEIRKKSDNFKAINYIPIFTK